MEKILITGASGFIGSFIVEEALRQGMEVWAAVRKASSTRYLTDERINLVELDLGNEAQMEEALADKVFDYVVHAAGVTKTLDISVFDAVNNIGTQNLATAIAKTSPSLKRFVFISSLSVYGAVREQEPYDAIRNEDTPQPNTEYGRSKLRAEQWLKGYRPVPFTILRPTGVYGPREKDYMMMVDSIKSGIDIAVGSKPQDLTFIYVHDVVQAVFKSMKAEAAVGKAYFISDGGVYSSRTFSDLIIKALDKRFVLRLTLPLWVLKSVCTVSEWFAHLTGKITTLNTDHYNILKQRNWRCDISPACKDFDYAPEWNLERGVNDLISKL